VKCRLTIYHSTGAARKNLPLLWFATALCTLSFSLFSACAYSRDADLTDLTLEQLLQIEIEVSSASKYAQKTTEAPSAVQVISANEIQRNGWKTLTETLSSLPGIYASGNGGYDFLGARGFLVPGDYGTRFLLLIDGKPNNDNIYQQAMFGNEGWLDLLNIERIEYVPGPGSSIYGSNAQFGAVNIITKKAGEQPVTQAGITNSQDGRRGVSVSTRRKVDETGLMLAYTQSDKAGRDRTYNASMGTLIRANGTPSTDGVAQRLDRQSNKQFLMRMDSEDASFTLISHERNTTPSAALYLTSFNDPSLQIIDGGTSLNFDIQHKISDAVSSSFRVGYTDFYYRGSYPYFAPGVGYYHNYDATQGKLLDGEANLLAQAGKHRILTGIEFAKDLVARQANFYSIDPALLGVSNFDTNHPKQRVGLFVQDEWQLTDSLISNIGLRFDKSSSLSGAMSPRLGLIWQANTAWTFKLLSGKSYRLPSQYEMYYGDGITFFPNPNLQPESIRTIEAVSEWRANEQTRWQMSLYDNHLNNLITKLDNTGTSMAQYQNRGGAHTQGVELGYIHESGGGLFARSSLSVGHANDDNGQRLDNSPNWLGKLSLSAPFFDENLRVAGELQGIGQRIHYWNGTLYNLPTQILSNLTLNLPNITRGIPLTIEGKTSAQLRISNLFNRAMNYPVSAVELAIPFVPQNGRTWMISINHEF
jgi:iron complex outermembrane receptor protein